MRWVLLAGAVLAVGLFVLMASGGGGGEPDVEDLELGQRAAFAPPEQLIVSIHRRYPHQRDAFTQGLLWHDGQIFESTGLRRQSTLRTVTLETGEVQRRRDIDPEYFAEGLARVDDRLVQLTWEAGRALVWSVDDFAYQRAYRYSGEGWGLCFDGEQLVMSDGTSMLTFRNPETFRIERRLEVRRGETPVDNLNELECVDGAVWANVWLTDDIVRIDPATGRVTGLVDASGLLTRDDRFGADVLNGIAYVPERDRFLITGKRWPWLFEVSFVPEDEGGADTQD